MSLTPGAFYSTQPALDSVLINTYDILVLEECFNIYTIRFRMQNNI